MRLTLVTLLTLIAFAANSVLNRAALAETGMDPGVFTAVRLVSGAVMLAGLVALRGGAPRWRELGSWPSAAALLVYAAAFSYAYIWLGAGVGALVLFGGVQITMFAGALARGQSPGPWRWAGSALGLTGLAVLVLPGASVPPVGGTGLMLVAAVAWGIYSLRGQGSVSALHDTCGNFLRAAPVAVVFVGPAIVGFAPAGISGAGLALAMASGALASGVGYAMWYSVLPGLHPSTAATAQLSVPIIAMAGGIVLLGEALTMPFIIASILILGGIALAIYGPKWKPLVKL